MLFSLFCKIGNLLTKKNHKDDHEQAPLSGKTTEQIREIALNKGNTDELRALAVKELEDPDICETVLSEPSAASFSNWRAMKERYITAASVLNKLGEQARLEQIYRNNTDWATKAIVIEQIDNPVLLEEAAIDEKLEIAENAIARIHDESTLARVAIKAKNKLINPVKEITDESLLQDIALHAGMFDIRIKAISRMEYPEAIAEDLKAEIFPLIISNPWHHSCELLARCGEPTARIILACTDSDTSIKITDKDYHEADSEFLYPILKRLLTSYVGSITCENRDLVPEVASAIRYMHSNGIMAKEIETDFPQTITYSYCYNSWTNEEERYKDDRDVEKTATLWSPDKQI